MDSMYLMVAFFMTFSFSSPPGLSHANGVFGVQLLRLAIILHLTSLDPTAVRGPSLGRRSWSTCLEGKHLGGSWGDA